MHHFGRISWERITIQVRQFLRLYSSLPCELSKFTKVGIKRKCAFSINYKHHLSMLSGCKHTNIFSHRKKKLPRAAQCVPFRPPRRRHPAPPLFLRIRRRAALFSLPRLRPAFAVPSLCLRFLGGGWAKTQRGHKPATAGLFLRHGRKYVSLCRTFFVILQFASFASVGRKGLTAC